MITIDTGFVLVVTQNMTLFCRP